jgi:hypothetical protein
MKKLACFILLAMALSSCYKATVVEEVQIIEGCEYLVSRNAHGNGLTHKGNCKNIIHKCPQSF